MKNSTIERDPLIAGRLSFLLLFILLMWPVLRGAEFNVYSLFDPVNLKVIGHFLAGFLPPATGTEFLIELFKATLETIAIATAGMALALLFAIPLAYIVSRVCRNHNSLQLLPRCLLTVLRGIPELVWALAFVRILGLGPGAGVLALGLTYGAMLGKVYAEILESVDQAPANALLTSGSHRALAILFGLLPVASKELTSYTIYRWECALRASVVMGFVGAGGLGQLMDQAMKMLNGGEACSILIVFFILVVFADQISVWLRKDTKPELTTHPLRLLEKQFLAWALLFAIIFSSYQILHLELASLISLEALYSLSKFALEFYPADLSTPWLIQIAIGMGQTLAISMLGTLLAVLFGLLLAICKPKWLMNSVFNVLRSVPELVWATITVLAVGMGAFAGTLALALHTTGVLGRLFSQALENTPRQPAQALRHAGTSSALVFMYASFPLVAPQLVAYSLYRWEMNIRMAAILGFVGAGGLGQLLYVSMSLMNYHQASTLILAMLLMSIMVDQTSARIRGLMHS